MLQAKDRMWVEDVIEKIKCKMSWVSEKSRNKIPFTTINGEHDNRGDKGVYKGGINWWTNGFWGGIMWLMYHETKEEKYAIIARVSEELLDECIDEYYGLHHDIGFMWLPTAVADYRLTGNNDSRRRGLHTANILAGRFNPVGKYIRAWNCSPNAANSNVGWAIIDCMMNLPILYWASNEMNDPRFKHVAMIHADTTMEHFIRPDGSSHHIVEFDPYNGGVVKTYAGQGYEIGSSWTRGQAWALYGFIISYIHTDKKDYLTTAKRIAHYFMANIPESGLIPIDFRQPKEPAFEDSTAAAIAACGLIEIARHVDDLEKEIYMNAALKLLKALTEKRCNWNEDNDCILEKCSTAYSSTDHEINLIYADYFFIEAMFKLKGNDYFMW